MNENQPNSSEPRPYHHGDLRSSLIDAALALVAEEQDWTFSLREVARRAGVSHNAPYNHFADKRDLLAAVGAAGFEILRHRMLAAISGIESAEKALVKSGLVYVNFGVENPAHYRLMFGSVLATAQHGRPEPLVVAGTNAKAVLADIILRGAREGIFVLSPGKKEEIHIAVLTVWSTMHGLTMLAIDGLAGTTPRLTIDDITKKLAHMVCYGLIRR
jgi:AcrR family transcriptional regulator